jgi:FkbM family methyltransferase
MRTIDSLATPALTITAPGQVVRSVILGQPIQFFISNPRDAIQKHHARGTFYETEELEIIRQWCPPGAVFCDIGANIGNHALYALKFLHPAKVVLFEPNPEVIRILLTNLGLNGVLDRCDISNLGIGLSDVPAENRAISAPRRNLGGGRIVESDQAEGGIPLRRGDDILHDIAPTFLKIDVEGMEMAVLAGLADTITRHRPTIFVEVDQVNRAAFLDWVTAQDYAVKARFRRYRANENFLIVPRRIARVEASETAPATQPAAQPAAQPSEEPAPAASITADPAPAAAKKPTAKSKAKAAGA